MAKTDRVIPNTYEIKAFFHCALCLEEVQKIAEKNNLPQSPSTYQRIEAGFTTLGIQVWCRRHDVNIVHIDFQGHKLPANTQRRAE